MIKVNKSNKFVFNRNLIAFNLIIFNLIIFNLIIFNLIIFNLIIFNLIIFNLIPIEMSFTRNSTVEWRQNIDIFIFEARDWPNQSGWVSRK